MVAQGQRCVFGQVSRGGIALMQHGDNPEMKSGVMHKGPSTRQQVIHGRKSLLDGLALLVTLCSLIMFTLVLNLL